MSLPSALRPLAAALLAALLLPAGLAGHEPGRGVPADDALLLLRAGNQRFATNAPAHFQQDPFRRTETARNGQKPFAVVLTCADSRVPPELIFDQGLGCLFVVRVAGNVARTDEVATVEYGVGHLGARLVLVLGHSRCGAVTAVVEEAPVGPNLAQLVAPIVPAAARARDAHPGLHGAPLVEAAVRANVRQTMADLVRLSPELALGLMRGDARLVGGIYDLESGEVEWLEPELPAAATSASAAPPAAADHH